MTSDLRELYQEVILDHNRTPSNFRALEGAAYRAEGYNPLCGDKIQVFLQLDGDRVEEVTFQGAGCAISQASASLMTEAVLGKTVSEARLLFEQFQELVTSETQTPDTDEGLGKLNVFAGVREYPMRVKCATLAWHTLKAALKDSAEPVSTE
ncbi:MAG: SUF system NifU family Fe-S cluster assembly protein [Deltaproteobacteria bacterium]|nr:SUF system NifU family Fe-S cluster assembly protein [Deltaproteobacteria bacterium]